MQKTIQVDKHKKVVAAWLFIGVGMLLVQIILGGITRLTGSGLSITEWDVVTGAFPPLQEEAWVNEFMKYKATPQYRLLNYDFTLQDFKSIFFWEWLHRFWARLMGLIFLIPFIIFLVKGYFKKEMVWPMAILFILGALQGAIGWIMVASGLTGDAIYVKPTRLALHFVFALGLLCYTYWFALSLVVRERLRGRFHNIKNVTLLIIGVLVLQLLYGALMAGHKAATAAPTWPTINEEWFPTGLVNKQYKLFNAIENKIFIQFTHRGIAYVLFFLMVWLTYSLKRVTLFSTLINKTWWVPLVLVCIQIVLGICSVLFSTGIQPGKWGWFETLALFHQITAILLLLSLVWILYISTKKVDY